LPTESGELETCWRFGFGPSQILETAPSIILRLAWTNYYTTFRGRRSAGRKRAARRATVIMRVSNNTMANGFSDRAKPQGRSVSIIRCCWLDINIISCWFPTTDDTHASRSPSTDWLVPIISLGSLFISLLVGSMYQMHVILHRLQSLALDCFHFAKRLFTFYSLCLCKLYIDFRSLDGLASRQTTALFSPFFTYTPKFQT